MSDLERAVSIVVEYLARRPGVRARLTEQTDSGMKAQDLEGSRSTGITIDTEEKGPRVTDTTGEAAIRQDRARRMLAELDQAEADLLTGANRLIGHPLASFATLAEVVVKHGFLMAPTVKASARVFDRTLGEVLGRKRPKAGVDHEGRPGCMSCARLKINGVPLWNEPDYIGGRPTDLGGGLDRKVSLCRSCQRWAVEQEPTRLPTVAELKHRHDDPAGRWPRRYAAPGTRAS